MLSTHSLTISLTDYLTWGWIPPEEGVEVSVPLDDQRAAIHQALHVVGHVDDFGGVAAVKLPVGRACDDDHLWVGERWLI